MHGPYTASIRIGRQEPLILDEAELREAMPAACRFYQDAWPAVVEGALRCGVFAAAALLAPGEDAEVEVFGFVAGKPTSCRRDRAHRDAAGVFSSTLGSRFNERVFRGV